MPLFKSALNDRGDDSKAACRDTNGEVENKIYSFNREWLSVDNCAKGKNKCGVDDISTDNVTDRKGILLLSYSGECCDKLGKLGSESDNCKSDNGFADSNSCGNGLTG